MPQLPWGLEFAPSDLPDGLKADWTFDPATERLAVTLENTGESPIALGRAVLAAETDLPADGGSLWLHGRDMQQDALIHNFGQPIDTTCQGDLTAIADDAHQYRSHELIAIARVTSDIPALVIGCLQPRRCFVDFEVSTDTHEEAIEELTISFDLRGVELAPGASLELPLLLLASGRDTLALVERFAAETAVEMQARVPGHVPAGWCSWYFFENRVTEADVLANLENLAASDPRVEFMQIDDGFQSRTGDWLVPNEKFPSGMQSLASRIREAGFRPGLWLEPFLLHEESIAIREHPEMVLKEPGGETLFVETSSGRCAVLDCTHPKAESWLRDFISTVVHDWGYSYLKLDALAAAAQAATRVRYHQPGTTAPMNLRRGLEIIREAAGDGAFLLGGLTCYFGPAIGLVDAMRVGPDVSTGWFDGPRPSVKHAMRMTLQRNWMHGRWWANDPDCLVVRDTETSLSEPETRFLATAVALSGGMVVLGDDLPSLSPARRAIADALTPPPASAARPLDMTDAPVPVLWRAEIGDGRFLVGALNWADEPRWVRRDELLRAGEVAFDAWEGKLLGMGDRLLQPHEGLLLQVAAHGSTPRVVGDTGHLAYERLYQRPVSGRIQVRNDSARPRTIVIEARGQLFEVTLAPNEMRWFD
jgi:alpha-galactosidase